MCSTIFEKNYLELKKNNEILAKKVCVYNYQDSVLSEVMRIDEKKILTVIKDEEYVQLDSLYASETLVKTLINSLIKDMALDAKFVMFGLGNGMYAKYYLEQTSEDHEIFVVEPSMDIFKMVLENFDLTDLFRDNRFHLEVLNEASETDYRVHFRKMFVYTDIYTLRYSVYPNYQIIFSEAANCWIEQIRYTLGLMGSEYKLYEDYGKKFVINNYACFPYVGKSKSLRSLVEIMPKKIPAFLVSAGPSLGRNIKDLQKAKGKSLIIAVDAAVNPLLKNGIVPDLMVAVDPIKGSDYIKEQGAELIPLVSGMNCCAGLTNAHKGEKIYISDLNPFLEVFFIKTCGMLPQLETGGSVSNSAFHLAYLLGCRSIILVGQDLAYTGKKSHAEGSVRGNETMDEIKENLVEDVDINGNPILTSTMFLRFKTWFEDFIAEHTDIHVVNSTEGGVMIKGTEVMSLKEAINLECKQDFDFKVVLDETSLLLNKEQGDDFLDYIDNLPCELDCVILQIHEGLKCYSSINRIAINGNLNSKELKTISSKVNEILDGIQNNVNLEYVKYLIQQYTNKMLKTINKTNSDVRKELIEISDIGTEYLKQLEKEILSMKDLIKECTDKWNQ